MSRSKRHNPANPTAHDALDNLEGRRVEEHHVTEEAERLRRIHRIRQQETYNRNARLRAAREQAKRAEGDVE